MSSWFISLGDFHETCGRVVRVSLDTKCRLSASLFAEYHPAADRAVSGKGLTGLRSTPQGLFAAHYNTIVHIPMNGGDAREVLRRDDWNDLHDLEVELDALGAPASLYVANTGYDQIQRVDMEGNLLWSHQLSPQSSVLLPAPNDPYFTNNDPSANPWRTKNKNLVHPNAIRIVGNKLWVSRLYDRRLTCLGFGVEVDEVVLPGCPHDLVHVEDALWCTTTDGKIWRINTSHDTFHAELVLDTWTVAGVSGWCRGLSLCEQWVMVAVTRIAHMPLDRWCLRPLENTSTALMLFERESLRLVDVLVLDFFGRHPKIFSVISEDIL
jgi:hypothetical protein